MSSNARAAKGPTVLYALGAERAKGRNNGPRETNRPSLTTTLPRNHQTKLNPPHHKLRPQPQTLLDKHLQQQPRHTHKNLHLSPTHRHNTNTARRKQHYHGTPTRECPDPQRTTRRTRPKLYPLTAKATLSLTEHYQRFTFHLHLSEGQKQKPLKTRRPRIQQHLTHRQKTMTLSSTLLTQYQRTTRN